MKRHLKSGWEYWKSEWYRPPLDHSDEQDISGKTIVITGANSGVGESASYEFAQRGATVVMACRNIPKARLVSQAITAKFPHAKLDLFPLDLGDLASVRKCAQEICAKYPKIHILVNNAGFASYNKQLEYTSEGFETHMAVNHLGPQLFTHLLMEPVKAAAPSRIVFVSSMVFQLGQLDIGDFMLRKRGSFLLYGFGPYCNSKEAVNYCVKILAKKLEGTGVNVYALCPGFVNSGFESGSGVFAKAVTHLTASKPSEGAQNILYCALMNSTAGQSGLMYRANGVWKGGMEGLDDKFGVQVWNKTMEYLGLPLDPI